MAIKDSELGKPKPVAWSKEKDTTWYPNVLQHLWQKVITWGFFYSSVYSVK